MVWARRKDGRWRRVRKVKTATVKDHQRRVRFRFGWLNAVKLFSAVRVVGLQETAKLTSEIAVRGEIL